MPKQRIAVIGGVASGPAAAAQAKRTDPDAEVVLFEQGNHISYGACELPYVVAGIIEDPEAVIHLTPAAFEASRGARVHIRHRVERIKAQRCRLVVRDLTTDTVREERFDKFILATGARAHRPNIPGLDAKSVFYLRTLADAASMQAFLDAHTVRHAVVLGGGYVGLEAADALMQRGVRVTLLDGGEGLLAGMLDAPFQAKLEKALAEAGLTIRGERATALLVNKANAVQAVATDQKERIGCDLVVVATGIVPNVEVAVDAGVKVGQTGAIAVNAQMRTNVPNIWACGDCIEVSRLIDQRKVLYPQALTAFRTARVAATNAARRGYGASAKFEGVIGNTAVKVFGYEIASAGLTLDEAKQAGFDAHSTTIKHWSRVKLYPGAERIHVCLVWEAARGRILGAQLIGRDGAALRSNTLVPLIRAKEDLHALESLDFVYTPPIAPSLDPLFIGAREAIKAWQKVRR